MAMIGATDPHPIEPHAVGRVDPIGGDVDKSVTTIQQPAGMIAPRPTFTGPQAVGAQRKSHAMTNQSCVTTARGPAARSGRPGDPDRAPTTAGHARGWSAVNSYATAPRTVAILTRTAHTGAMAVFVGGRILHAPAASLRPWRWLTTLTGVALLASEATHSRNWIHQGRGMTTTAHIAVLAAGHLSPRLATAGPVAALLIGGVASHLPKSVRTWSVLHRSVVP